MGLYVNRQLTGLYQDQVPSVTNNQDQFKIDPYVNWQAEQQLAFDSLEKQLQALKRVVKKQQHRQYQIAELRREVAALSEDAYDQEKKDAQVHQTIRYLQHRQLNFRDQLHYKQEQIDDLYDQLQEVYDWSIQLKDDQEKTKHSDKKLQEVLHVQKRRQEELRAIIFDCEDQQGTMQQQLEMQATQHQELQERVELNESLLNKVLGQLEQLRLNVVERIQGLSHPFDLRNQLTSFYTAKQKKEINQEKES